MNEQQEPNLKIVPEVISAKPAIEQEERDFLNAKLNELRRVYFIMSDANPTIDIPEVSQRLKIPGGEAAAYCNALVTIGLLKVEKSLVEGVGGSEINRNHFVRTYSPI